MYQTYGNRALALIKIKCILYIYMVEFQKALNDCDSAIRLNPKYTKAYHRKAKALLGISK